MDKLLENIIALIGDNHGAQKLFAKSVGASANIVTDWKSGKNKSYPMYASRIADYFNVSLDYLYGRTDVKNPLQESSGLDVEFYRLTEKLTDSEKALLIAQLRGIIAARSGND